MQEKKTLLSENAGGSVFYGDLFHSLFCFLVHFACRIPEIRVYSRLNRTIEREGLYDKAGIP